MSPKVLITGASGLLGRAVVNAFRSRAFDVYATAYSRASGTVLKLDLCDPAATESTIRGISPDVIVNVAAERHPEVCQNNAAATERLNVDAVWGLARLARQINAIFIQISTDYLFDGTAAPYSEASATSPPNEYGKQKLRGEYAALAAHTSCYVLRVPVLYGPTSDLTESAVTMFAATVLADEKPASVDDWQIRVPTYTPDVGETLVLMASAALANRLPAGIYNYSSNDRVTRWALCQMFSTLLSKPCGHITKLEGMPPGAPRPYDCQLTTDKLASAGCCAPRTPLLTGLTHVLRQYGAVL